MNNPLKQLPVERLAKRQRELNASVDRLVKSDHEQAHEARMKLHRKHLATSALVALTVLLYAGLGVLAALQIDDSPLEEIAHESHE